MNASPEDKHDFTDEIDRHNHIIDAEFFLYGGDPRAVGMQGLMRARRLAQPSGAARDEDSKVVDAIDLTNLPVKLG